MRTASKFLLAITVSASLSARAEEDEKAGEHKSDPVAKIRTAVLRREKIAETITAYGTIQTLPTGTHTLAAPFECRVKKVRAVEGQAVEKGALLVELEPSPDSKLLLQSTISALASARLALTNVSERFAMKLTTTADLQTAQQSVQDAELKLANLRERGIEGDPSLHAADAGTVSRIDAQAGAIVASGASLVEISGESSRVAKLGIEPSDIENVSVGKMLSLKSVTRPDAKAVNAKVSMLAKSIDLESRLVIVSASLPEDDGLLLGENILATVNVSEKDTLVAPRSAALPEEDHFVVFTVKDGKAVKHEVRLGIRAADLVEISGGDLKDGDTVVIEGNYELTDGMKVGAGGEAQEEKTAPKEDAKTEPAK